MAEPSTVTAASTTLISGITLASVISYIDAQAALGAFMGAAFVAATKSDVRAWKRLFSFLFSALCGYGGADEFVAQNITKHSFFPALVIALVIVPLALRLISVIPEIDATRIREWLIKFLGGR